VKRHMMILAILAVVGLVFLNVPAVQAQQPEPPKPIPSSTPTQTVNNQTAVACNLCFTCGGDWPVFAGALHQSSTEHPTERGSGCSGAFTSRADSFPFLCCR
jgi:hypothetical protein